MHGIYIGMNTALTSPQGVKGDFSRFSRTIFPQLCRPFGRVSSHSSLSSLSSHKITTDHLPLGIGHKDLLKGRQLEALSETIPKGRLKIDRDQSWATFSRPYGTQSCCMVYPALRAGLCSAILVRIRFSVEVVEDCQTKGTPSSLARSLARWETSS